MSETTKTETRYTVKYYDAKESKKGRGVWVRTFTNRDEAEKFASENKLYARPCVVVEVK